MPPTGTTAAQPAQQHAEKLLNHLLEAIMGYPPNSHVKQALTSAGVGSVKDLLTLDGELFSQLFFTVGSEERKLKLLDVAKLKRVSSFHMALCTSESGSRIAILPDDLWFQTKETNWDEFRVGSTARHQQLLLWQHYLHQCQQRRTTYARRSQNP